VLGNKTLVPHYCCGSQTGHAKSSGILKLVRITLVHRALSVKEGKHRRFPSFVLLKEVVVFTVHHHVMRVVRYTEIGTDCSFVAKKARCLLTFFAFLEEMIVEITEGVSLSVVCTALLSTLIYKTRGRFSFAALEQAHILRDHLVAIAFLATGFVFPRLLR
jgi:hypothetical protein